MKTLLQRARRPAFVVAAMLLVTACTSGRAVSPAVPPELKHSWEVAFNRGDAGAVAALYAPDGQLVMPGAEPVRGRDAIRAAVADMIKSGAKVAITTEENIGAGDVAYVYGPYRVVDSKGQVVEAGHYVETWRRSAGQWQIDIDINTAGPAAGVPAAKAE